MKIQDYMVLKGNFKVRAEKPKTGESWIHYEEPNTIVLIAKRDTIRLIGGDQITKRILTKMKFGDGGHISDPLDPAFGLPIPTYESQTDLHNVIITKTLSLITFTDGASTSSGIFNAMIDTYEGNGGGTQIYSEAGLFTDDETLNVGGVPNSGLFAVKNFPIISKTAEIRLVFDWTITL